MMYAYLREKKTVRVISKAILRNVALKIGIKLLAVSPKKTKRQTTIDIANAIRSIGPSSL